MVLFLVDWCIFIANAMSKQNIFEGILVMMIFGISTLPAMLFF